LIRSKDHFRDGWYQFVPACIITSSVCHRFSLSQQVATSKEDEKLLALLRTKGLSIKNLDDGARDELRALLDKLCNSKGMSLNDLAKLIGNKTSGYTSWLCRQLGVAVKPFEEARLKGIKEKRRKYERKPFDGTDEDRAYLLGLRHGDLSVSRPWNGVVRVSTSTTHPAMASLFRSLFEPHGHVYQHPRYKKDTGTYEWNLSTILDNSFEFLLDDQETCWDCVSGRESLMLAYLAGVLDSEGNIWVGPAKLKTAITVSYYNTNLELLRFVHRVLTMLGYNPLEPYLDKAKGFRSPGYHIEMKKDYWRVVLARFKQSQSLLERMPIRHDEKIAKQRLALTLEMGEPWENVEDKVQSIRTSIHLARDQFVQLAEREFLKNHPKPAQFVSSIQTPGSRSQGGSELVTSP